MSYERYFRAIECALAELIAEFADLPDLYMREVDLHAALFHALQQQAMLIAPYRTRDGRRTGLVHREYPTFFAFEEGLEVPEGICRGYYDVAVLSPAFVRGYDLETVANSNSRRAHALRALPQDERPIPLLAAIDVKLIEVAEPTTLEELETDFHELVRSEPDALRCYLAVFCRHWDLNGPMRRVLDMMERWACNHPHVAMVFVQAFSDDMGRVFGGRYLNQWSYMAPLPPWGAPYFPRLQRTSFPR